MANEKRLIDANALKKAIWNVDCNVYEFCEGCVTEMGLSRLLLDDVIDDVPTVDAAEVVRCKDCTFRVWDDVCKEYYCDSALGMCGAIDDNSFCSYGEKEEER